MVKFNIYENEAGSPGLTSGQYGRGTSSSEIYGLDTISLKKANEQKKFSKIVEFVNKKMGRTF
jgi:hypothetical protein